MSAAEVLPEPLGDRVLIEDIAPVEITAGGVYLPEVAQEKTNRGVVRAVGSGRQSEMTGRTIPIPVELGDEVLYSKYAGTLVEVGGREYSIVRSDDLIGRIPQAEVEPESPPEGE